MSIDSTGKKSLFRVFIHNALMGVFGHVTLSGNSFFRESERAFLCLILFIAFSQCTAFHIHRTMHLCLICGPGGCFLCPGVLIFFCLTLPPKWLFFHILFFISSHKAREKNTRAIHTEESLSYKYCSIVKSEETRGAVVCVCQLRVFMVGQVEGGW